MESFPFKSLTELYDGLKNLISWPHIIPLRESVEYVYQGFEIHSKKLRLTKSNRDNVPKTLLCHDMKGGYLEDRFIDGSNSNEAYLFYHWSVIDTFVYFSHYFITIPPYGWINAAHSHGVKVLGTVITEHTDGERIWEIILESKEAAERFANALIEIATFYKFEGWLLNVENKIKPEDINNLVYFVKYLSDRIHQEIIGSEIIWYDSVINTGELKWQNELNEKNKEFFLNCDGIFLNYNWTDSLLSSSYILAKNSGRDAKDVYVGLDVWGRGCPGGGGFNSAHALERIRKQNLSVAIFAPGWTHEYFGPKTFYQLEDMFWAQLFPFLHIHVPIYDNEIFKTSFCRGSGSTYCRSGMVQLELDGKPFYNLSMQKLQISVPVPLLRILDCKEEVKPVNSDNDTSKKETHYIYETEKAYVRVHGNVVNFEPKSIISNENSFEFCTNYSYEGGGCLKLVTKTPRRYHRLFLVHIEFDRGVQGTIVYKPGETSTSSSHHMIDEPVLILGNDTGLKSVVPYESFELNASWRKCIYLTDLKTVNEIGVEFSRESSCYLGEIILEGKHRRYDRCESADCANRISDYTVY
ncbi:hypothetical protein KPH14_007916 [Odynerus spinipes]|uniref:Cytosolic endo-beta-N-acetylglucosaminidase n=1 Tax=Odynerus spinipes TaxID=1348599 RepID=A0AAD9RJU4_9HYME|nr:hypothetical protein KPH14_007916 [Odynerus spinipes]